MQSRRSSNEGKRLTSSPSLNPPHVDLHLPFLTLYVPALQAASAGRQCRQANKQKSHTQQSRAGEGRTLEEESWLVWFQGIHDVSEFGALHSCISGHA